MSMHTNTATDIPSADVEFYQRNGWYISDYIIDQDSIDRCIEAAENIYRGQYDHIQPWSRSPHIQNFATPHTDRSRLRVDQYPSFHSDAIRTIVHSWPVAALAANLLKTTQIRYYKDILIGTPALDIGSQSAIGWHTDISYWPTCIPERMITVYVPLQDRDRHNGTLVMINGSNHWPGQSFNLTVSFDELDKIKRKYEQQGYSVQLCDLPHKKGQVSFHSSSVIHATHPNTSEQFQYTIVYGLQARENRFVPSPLKRLNKSMVINLNDEIGPRLADGTPDITNDDFYPVLFSGDP